MCEGMPGRRLAVGQGQVLQCPGARVNCLPPHLLLIVQRQQHSMVARRSLLQPPGPVAHLNQLWRWRFS